MMCYIVHQSPRNVTESCSTVVRLMSNTVLRGAETSAGVCLCHSLARGLCPVTVCVTVCLCLPGVASVQIAFLKVRSLRATGFGRACLAFSWLVPALVRQLPDPHVAQWLGRSRNFDANEAPSSRFAYEGPPEEIAAKLREEGRPKAPCALFL